MADGLKERIDCETCKAVVLTGDDLDHWNMICECERMVTRPGGVDADGVRLMYEIYNVPAYDRREVLEKLLAIVEEAIDAAEDDKK